MTGITPEQKAKMDAACDDIERLLESATEAVRGNDLARAGRLLKQVHDLADTLPKKDAPS